MLQYILKLLTKINIIYKIIIGDTDEKDYFNDNDYGFNIFKFVFI